MDKLPHNYSALAPTVMSVEDIYQYLDELLMLIESREFDEIEVCVALDELIVTRLSDNYKTIDPEYSSRVFKWLLAHWPKDDLEHLDLYLTIMANLNEVTEVKTFLESKLAEEQSPERRELISEALPEIMS